MVYCPVAFSNSVRHATNAVASKTWPRKTLGCVQVRKAATRPPQEKKKCSQCLQAVSAFTESQDAEELAACFAHNFYLINHM